MYFVNKILFFVLQISMKSLIRLLYVTKRHTECWVYKSAQAIQIYKKKDCHKTGKQYPLLYLLTILLIITFTQNWGRTMLFTVFNKNKSHMEVYQDKE